MENNRAQDREPVRESTGPTAKNRGISIIKTGKRPQQGIMELVSTAMVRSLGDWMDRQQATPAALHPRPRAMVTHCPPQAPHFSNMGSMPMDALGRNPRSSSRVKKKRKTARGGSMMAVVQESARNPPWTRQPVSQGAAPRYVMALSRDSSSRDRASHKSREGKPAAIMVR